MKKFDYFEGNQRSSQAILSFLQLYVENIENTREQKTSYMKCYKLIVYVDESFDPFSVAVV